MVTSMMGTKEMCSRKMGQGRMFGVDAVEAGRCRGTLSSGSCSSVLFAGRDGM